MFISDLYIIQWLLSISRESINTKDMKYAVKKETTGLQCVYLKHFCYVTKAKSRKDDTFYITISCFHVHRLEYINVID